MVVLIVINAGRHIERFRKTVGIIQGCVGTLILRLQARIIEGGERVLRSWIYFLAIDKGTFQREIPVTNGPERTGEVVQVHMMRDAVILLRRIEFLEE